MAAARGGHTCVMSLLMKVNDFDGSCTTRSVVNTISSSSGNIDRSYINIIQSNNSRCVNNSRSRSNRNESDVNIINKLSKVLYIISLFKKIAIFAIKLEWLLCIDVGYSKRPRLCRCNAYLAWLRPKYSGAQGLFA